MTRAILKVLLSAAALLVLLPAAAFAQEGQIAGTIHDPMEAVMPGVTVEVSSPALIEKIRSTTSGPNGQYRITNLPVGTYKVTFSLSGFTKQEVNDVVLTSGFTAPVNATMKVGQLTETVIVTGVTPTVDVQNAREVITFAGDRVREMPTSRNVNSLLTLTPGISSQYTTSTAQSPFGAPGVCVGGVGVFCNPGISGFNIGDRGTAVDQSNMAQGRVLVDGVVVNQEDRRRSSARQAATPPTSRTLRRSTSACRARLASPRTARPRSTSCRAPAATGLPATSS